MNKVIVLLCIAFAGGIAGAQPADPAGGGVPMPPLDPQPGAARKACTEAMNSDPDFAKSILATVDKQIDQKTIDAQNEAAYHIAKNKRHVIYAYAAMWVIAALFVVFLWRRQQLLRAEIAQLRKDLDDAAKES